MAKTSTASSKNYGVFNKATAEKSGWITVTKTFATRELARKFKRSKNFRYGIFNMKTSTVVR